MDLRLLRYLIATVDAGSATRAAKALHVTQPVLSRQLRELERRLGLTLFDRSGNRLVITRAGDQFVRMARDLVERADQVHRAAADLASGHLRELHLAVPTTTLTDVVAPFLASLRGDDPLPIVRELDPAGSLAAIRAGADLAIVTRPPVPALASRPLARLPVWAYTPAGYPLEEEPEVTLAQLVAHPLVLMTPAYRPRGLLDAAVDNAGLSYSHILECTNAQVAQALAASGRGIAVVSDDPRFDLSPSRIRVGGDYLSIQLYAAWNGAHHAHDLLAEFAERLAHFCTDRYGDVLVPATGL